MVLGAIQGQVLKLPSLSGLGDVLAGRQKNPRLEAQ
jgi:hypothetical protein